LEPATPCGSPDPFNLIGNAIKFTEVGEIRVAARPWRKRGPRALALSVTDTGIGMTEAPIGAPVSAFAQADSSTTRRTRHRPRLSNRPGACDELRWRAPRCRMLQGLDLQL